MTSQVVVDVNNMMVSLVDIDLNIDDQEKEEAKR